MRTIRLHARADLRLNDEPDPIPVSGEELLIVKAVGMFEMAEWREGLKVIVECNSTHGS